MTTEQLIATEDAARKAWEATTKVGDYTIAQLRQISDGVFNETDWKLPWVAYVSPRLVDLVIQATKFFHADVAQVHGIQPLTGNVKMSGRGYQAD